LLAARLLAKTPTSTHMVAGLAGARRARRRAAQAQPTVSMRTVASSTSLWTAPTGCCERADNNNNADATSGSSSASEESNISYSS